jgi:hypothetical protein
LTETGGLRLRIENATRDVKEEYERTLETVGKLKEKMNELEGRISREKPKEAGEDLNSLRSAMESLDGLTDSQILKSKEAWKKYEELKHDCEMRTSAPPELDELRILCRKTEQMAADLLCYSLGFVRRKTFESS